MFNIDGNQGVVQFVLAGDAADVLSYQIHEVNCMDLYISADHFWNQPDFRHNPEYIHMGPSHQDSPLQILNALNNDCLEATLLNLDFNSLLNAAQVCSRFEECARTAAAIKFKDMQLPGEVNDDDVMKSLELFGAKVRSLDVDGSQMQAFEFYTALAQHCKQLESLKLFNITIPSEVTESLLPIFRRLQKLKLEWALFQYESLDLISAAENLIVLDLHRCDIGNGLCIDREFFNIEVNTVLNFIRRNQTLEKLTVKHTGANIPLLINACSNSPKPHEIDDE